MSRLYDVTIMGEGGLDCWMTAYYFAAMDLRVLLILRHPPDPEITCFPEMPVDPARSAGILAPIGLATSANHGPRCRSDLQIIVEGRPVDIVADQECAAVAAGRDLQELAPAFKNLSLSLIARAKELTAAALESGFPNTSLHPKAWLGRRNLRKRFGGEAARELSEVDPLLRCILLAGVSALRGMELTGNSPLAQVAILWHALSGLDPATGPDREIRERAAELIARRGQVMAAEPEALIQNGRAVRGIRVKGGTVFDTRFLVANLSRLAKLTGAATGSGRQVAARKTFFFTIERETIPEALAERAVVVRDTGRPLAGDNLLLLTRSRRVPKRETLAVTLNSPPPSLAEDDVPKLLEHLPWLDVAALKPDQTRQSAAPRVYLQPDFFAPWRVKTPFENVAPMPGEILPAWGPLGISLGVAVLKPEVLKYLKSAR